MEALEREQLQDKISSLQAQLQEAQKSLQLVGQPHAFLLEQLTASRAKADEVAKRCTLVIMMIITIKINHGK
jgi:hypothetical protein